MTGILRRRLHSDKKPAVGSTLQAGSDIVLRLLFNENGGKHWRDLSMNRNLVTQEGSSTAWSVGKFGRALKFPGTNNNNLQVASAACLRPTHITIIAWIKRLSTSTDQNALVLPYAGVTAPSFVSYSMKPWETGSSAAYMEMGVTGSIVKVAVTSAVVTDRWQQWVMTSNGVTLKAYIDGIWRGSVAAAGPVYSGSDNLFIGTGTSTVNPFNGFVDNITIVRRVYTDNEIAHLFAHPFADISHHGIGRVAQAAAGFRSRRYYDMISQHRLGA